MGLLVLLSLAFHAALFSDFAHSSVGGGDRAQFLWDLWHFSRRLSEGGDTFWTDWQLYPLGTSLAFHTYAPFLGLLSVPLLSILGLVATYNLWLVFSTLLAATATYGLARSQGQERAAATVAGAIFALAPALTVRHVGHLNLSMAGLVPLGLLCLERFLARPAPLRTALLAGAVAAVLYTDAYLSFFLLLLCGIRLGAAWRAGSRFPILGLAGAFGLTALLAAPLVAALLRDYPAYAAHLARPQLERRLSADLADYFTPPRQSWLWGRVLGLSPERFGQDVEHQLFLGATALGLAVLGLAGRRSAARAGTLRGCWALAGGLFLVLSLGPRANLWGFRLESVPLPYAGMEWLPLLRGLRASERCGQMVALALAMLAGAGAARLVRARAWVLLPLVLLIVAESFKPGRAARPVLLPQLLEPIGRQSQPFCVLELPLGWQTGTRKLGLPAPETLLLQTLHQKKSFFLSVSRADLGAVEDYFLQLPMFQAFLDIFEGRAASAADPRGMAQGFDFFDVRYVVLDTGLRALTPARRTSGSAGAARERRFEQGLRNLETALQATGQFRQIGEESGYKLYLREKERQVDALECCSDPSSRRYWFGAGWTWKAAAADSGFLSSRAEAPVFLPLPALGRTYQVLLRLHAERALELRIEDRRGLVATLDVLGGCNLYRFELGPDRAELPVKTIFLRGMAGDAGLQVEQIRVSVGVEGTPRKGTVNF